MRPEGEQRRAPGGRSICFANTKSVNDAVKRYFYPLNTIIVIIQSLYINVKIFIHILYKKILTTTIYGDNILSNKEIDEAEALGCLPVSESRLTAERAVAGLHGVPLPSAAETR
jgi:hypothetical protein